MVSNAPSALSMAAMAFYGIVVLACISALITAMSERQELGQVRGWALLAVFFAVLIVLRWFNLEEMWRDALRDWARGDQTYGEREGYQRPLTGGLVVVAALAAIAWVALAVRRMNGRRSMALVIAQIAGLAMLLLIMLRMISFNVLDKLLFGPLKLNWVGDLGSAAVVAGAAVFYILIVRGKLGQRRVRKDRL